MRPGHVPGLNLVPVKATKCGFWLLVGKNSRVNHSEVKEGLLREIHSIDRGGRLRRQEAQGMGFPVSL